MGTDATQIKTFLLPDGRRIKINKDTLYNALEQLVIEGKARVVVSNCCGHRRGVENAAITY